MKYLDKEIVRLRNEQKKSRYINTVTGMYAGNVLITFERTEIFPGIFVRLPEGFGDMDANLASKKYPSDHRPQVIRTDDNGEVNFTFNLFHETISSDQMEGTLDQFKILIQMAQPANQFMDGGALKGEASGSWMDFKSYSLDGPLYNIISLTGFTETFVMGMFNIPYGNWRRWKPIVLEVLKTICLEEETDESSEYKDSAV